MAFHYSQDTAKALLRLHIEQHQSALVATGDKARVKVNQRCGALIAELLGELHHAKGPIEVDYASKAFANFYANSEDLGADVRYAVELGLLLEPKEVKVATLHGFATTAMRLELSDEGKAFIRQCGSAAGRNDGAIALSKNRKRMVRPPRGKNRARKNQVPVMASSGTQQVTNSDSAHREEPPVRRNQNPQLGERKTPSEASKNRLGSGSHREKEIQERFKREQELRTTQSVPPPIPVGQKVQFLEKAVALYEARQKEFGGIRTDARTLDSLKQQVVGLSDDEVAHACGVALRLASSWAWNKDNGYPSTCCAGEAISAVLGGRAWSPVPGETCTPCVGETYSWDDDLGTFVDELGFDVFEQQLIEDALEPHSAVDRECHAGVLTASVDTVLNAFESRSTRPIEACLSESPSPDHQFISTPSNGPEVQPRSYGSAAEQIARLRAARPDLCPTSRSPGRYGSRHGGDEGGCGEEYFNALEAQRKSIPAELPF